MDHQSLHFPTAEGMRGSQSLSPRNRSFSCPCQMDVDMMWQWSMRLWFLITAREEGDGHGLSGWEWMESRGHFSRNHWVPWFVSPLTQGEYWPEFPSGDSFPITNQKHFTLKLPSVYKTYACSYGDSHGFRGRRPWRMIISYQGKCYEEWGRYLTQSIKMINAIEISTEWVRQTG